MPTLESTRDLMKEAHAGQFDKAGLPYYTHPERVLDRLLDILPTASNDAQYAALLHDTFEDTSLTEGELAMMGYNETTIQYIKWLTRDHNLSYMDWIQKIIDKAPTEVLYIKLADNMDNSDPARIAQLPEAEQGIAWRYQKSMLALNKELVRRFV